MRVKQIQTCRGNHPTHTTPQGGKGGNFQSPHPNHTTPQGGGKQPTTTPHHTTGGGGKQPTTTPHHRGGVGRNHWGGRGWDGRTGIIYMVAPRRPRPPPPWYPVMYSCPNKLWTSWCILPPPPPVEQDIPLLLRHPLPHTAAVLCSASCVIPSPHPVEQDGFPFLPYTHTHPPCLCECMAILSPNPPPVALRHTHTHTPRVCVCMAFSLRTCSPAKPPFHSSPLAPPHGILSCTLVLQ